MNKPLKIIIAVITAVLLLLVLVWSLMAQRIALNPEGTVGNTAGNLYNEGLFCEYDGTVYFSNSNTNGGLFRMSPDESNISRINTLKVRNLLAGGKYLYYYESGTLSTNSEFGVLTGTKSFNRCELDGRRNAALSRELLSTAQLVGNYLYMMTSNGTSNSFYKLKIDASEKVELADYVINPACASGGYLYYSGSKDLFLHQLNTSTDVDRVLWEEKVWNPVVDGDYVYYMDVSNNYRLCHYSLSLGTVDVLTEDRVDCFNVGSGYIYYQKNDATSPQLICMYTDGTNAHAIAGGNYTHINMTSRYVYFQAFGDDKTLYHSPLGSNSCEIFYAAMEAASKEQK